MAAGSRDGSIHMGFTSAKYHGLAFDLGYLISIPVASCFQLWIACTAAADDGFFV